VGDASVGGVVASAGARALATAYGAVRDQVLGLTLVTGDGRVLELGGAVVKNVAGFDLVRLIVGSRGALGVVTRVTLRTHPRFRCERYLSVSAPRPEALLPAVDGVLGAPLLPASIELAGGPDGAELLVRVVGSEVQVAHAEQVLTARMGPSVRGLEPEAGALHQRVLRAAAGAGARVLHARPSASGVEDLLARLRSAAAAAATGAPRFWALPDQGVAWVAGQGGRSGLDPERSPAQEAVFDAAPGAAPGAGVASDGAPDAAVQALEAGLHAVFDPFGVLGGVAEQGDRP
jgi:glycolate oxidase FAD binding subunit